MKSQAALHLLFCFGLLSSCQREDFEARYDKTEEKLKAEAKQIDKDLSVQLEDIPNDTTVNGMSEAADNR